MSVTTVTGKGSNMDISVQPCSVLDPTAVFGASTIYPAGAAPSSQLQTYTFLAPKMTQ